MSMRKTTVAPGQLLSSVHMEKSYLSKAGYPVLYNGLPASRSCPGATKNSGGRGEGHLSKGVALTRGGSAKLNRGANLRRGAKSKKYFFNFSINFYNF